MLSELIKGEIIKGLEIGGIKVKVNPAQSKEIQDYLIFIGYIKGVVGFNEPFIYAYEGRDNRYLFSNRMESVFNETNLKEIILEAK